MATLSQLLMGGGALTQPDAAVVNPTPTWQPDDTIARQYKLSDLLRQQQPASSWAGVLAHGLGAFGGNIVQGKADSALASNAALRKQSLQALGKATDASSAINAGINSPDPSIQSAAADMQLKRLSDDPNKEFKTRLAQGQSMGLKGDELTRFALTAKMHDPNTEGMFGKTGAVFQGDDGKFYTIQFGGNGERRILPVSAPGAIPPPTAAGPGPAPSGPQSGNTPGQPGAAPPVSLRPSRPVQVVGDEVIDGATGQPVRNVAPAIAGGEAAKVTGKGSAEGALGLPKAKIALADYKIRSGIVHDNIANAKAQVGGWTSGSLGSLSKAIPGTPAYDLGQTLNTIKANIGFDELQRMRDNSPTGGALGQVTEQETALLQATKASIDQSQTPEQLQANLDKLDAIQTKYDALKQQAYETDVARFGRGNVPDPTTGELPAGGRPRSSLDNAINNAMTPRLSESDKAASLANARAAIAQGKDRNAIIQKLQAAGIDPSGL